MSHGNELSSRVEMRHRADAVFYVSIPLLVFTLKVRMRFTIFYIARKVSTAYEEAFIHSCVLTMFCYANSYILTIQKFVF